MEGRRSALLVSTLVCGCGFHPGAAGSAPGDAPGTSDAVTGDASTSDGNTQVTVFQQGTAGYAGTQDTFLDESAPSAARGADNHFECDLSVMGTFQTIGLLRFDGTFGAGPDRVPAGASIVSATISVWVSDPTAMVGELHEALIDWAQGAATWDNFGGEPAVQSDELGPVVAGLPVGGGLKVIDVTASVAAWSSGAPGFGWVLVATSTDGLTMYSSEHSTATSRPLLRVEWLP